MPPSPLAVRVGRVGVGFGADLHHDDTMSRQQGAPHNMQGCPRQKHGTARWACAGVRERWWCPVRMACGVG